MSGSNPPGQTLLDDCPRTKDRQTEGKTAPLSSAVGGLGAGRIPREAVADEGATPASPDKLFRISLDSVTSGSPPPLVSNHKDAARKDSKEKEKDEVSRSYFPGRSRVVYFPYPVGQRESTA
ncbi:hypothetical protein GE061_013869 [Apolygus lucorum]|uniref:Uncharacterized protein n=1 Tax=Apolygus lucorum TaxID=248454 RepID=A0A6A4JY18_APOLU|nr:hypothetical protein GE061_013869 [Apolygus lucorum]